MTARIPPGLIVATPQQLVSLGHVRAPITATDGTESRRSLRKKASRDWTRATVCCPKPHVHARSRRAIVDLQNQSKFIRGFLVWMTKCD